MSDLQLVHASAGRLRLRLPAATVDPSEAIRAEPGVVGCRFSPRTRSLLILYRHDAADVAALTDVVARLTGARLAAVRRGLEPEPVTGEPGAALSAGLRDAVRTVDQGVQRASRGALGLGSLVPLALIGWAVYELARGRRSTLAWSTALWYAHGLYRDYARSPSRD
jgi:hypothetical protein